MEYLSKVAVMAYRGKKYIGVYHHLLYYLGKTMEK
jgi:hypothetical protein